MSRVALVTGGTRGIGAAIARALIAAQYQVAVTYGGNDVAARTFEAETGIKTFKWDVSDYEACAQGIQKVQAAVGPIDILVNNAGITADSTLAKMTPEQWQRVLRVNLDSVFNMCRPLVPLLREQGFGRIINISSINGLKGQAGQTNYCAAKAGIVGFTKALALELATKGVTVNAIAPGYTKTDMVAGVREDILEKIIAQIPVGRLGTPAEIARCVVFLASDDASFITGATFSANGGQYMA
jgi:acetoacetyl-CoA reductase